MDDHARVREVYGDQGYGDIIVIVTPAEAIELEKPFQPEAFGWCRERVQRVDDVLRRDRDATCDVAVSVSEQESGA
jgi:hypothetical protein